MDLTLDFKSVDGMLPESSLLLKSLIKIKMMNCFLKSDEVLKVKVLSKNIY